MQNNLGTGTGKPKPNACQITVEQEQENLSQKHAKLPRNKNEKIYAKSMHNATEQEGENI